MVVTGTRGGGGGVGAEVGIGGGKLKFTLASHMQKDNMPACTLNSAPAVARNGRPKMIGMWGLSSMSTT